MLNEFSSILIKVKTYLIHILNDHQYAQVDAEQLEYLIQYIDWMLVGDIDITTKTIETLMEEIVTTSVHQVNFSLLDTLNDLCKIESELYGKI